MSLLTALVILIVGFYETRIYDTEIITASQNSLSVSKTLITLILTYACFAFLISMVRELVKDLEDMEGDEQYGSRTLPIVLGINRTKGLIAVVTLILMLSIGYIEWLQLISQQYTILIYSLLTIQVPLAFFLARLWTSAEKGQLRMLSGLIKATMLMGILSMAVLYILMRVKL